MPGLVVAHAGPGRFLYDRVDAAGYLVVSPLTALRLVGTPPSLLRVAQWLEAALPTVLDSTLAIVLGAYAGATYLQLDEGLTLPVRGVVVLAGAAALAAALLAAVTVIGTAGRLAPEHIRAE